jgi:hypothetical protein
VSFAAITLCVASQLVFIVVIVYFVIDPVRKLLSTYPHMRSTSRMCLLVVQHLTSLFEADECNVQLKTLSFLSIPPISLTGLSTV